MAPLEMIVLYNYADTRNLTPETQNRMGHIGSALQDKDFNNV
jgi:hypothetical protein